MGQDAVALVRIPTLKAPKDSGLTVARFEDCAIVFTHDRFAHFTPDEHAMRLKEALGKRLDAHDDERGILFFSDVAEVDSDNYRDIVREVGRAGKWGLAERLTEKGSPKIDRLLRLAASEQGLDRAWFVRHTQKKLTSKERGELSALVEEIVNTLVDDSGGRRDQHAATDLVEARVRAAARGEIPLTAPAPKRKREPKLTQPGEPGYDSDVAEMVKLLGGDEASWRAALGVKEPPAAERGRAKRERCH